ncbi:MAG: hypothetical protein ACOYBC_03800 [Bilifractor sp.]
MKKKAKIIVAAAVIAAAAIAAGVAYYGFSMAEKPDPDVFEGAYIEKYSHPMEWKNIRDVLLKSGSSEDGTAHFVVYSQPEDSTYIQIFPAGDSYCTFVSVSTPCVISWRNNPTRGWISGNIRKVRYVTYSYGDDRKQNSWDLTKFFRNMKDYRCNILDTRFLGGDEDPEILIPSYPVPDVPKEFRNIDGKRMLVTLEDPEILEVKDDPEKSQAFIEGAWRFCNKAHGHLTVDPWEVLAGGEEKEIEREVVATKKDGSDPVAVVSLPCSVLPKENSTLYSLFPELKEYAGKEGVNAFLCFEQIPTEEETMQMLLPEGQKIDFNGATLDEGHENAGKEIRSFDDLYRLYFGHSLEEGPTEYFIHDMTN